MKRLNRLSLTVACRLFLGAAGSFFFAQGISASPSANQLMDEINCNLPDFNYVMYLLS